MNKRINLIILGLLVAVNAVAAFANWSESPALAICGGIMANLLSFVAGRISKS